MKRPIILSTTAVGAGLLLAIAAPLSASAHVSVDASTTAAGSYSVLTFGVGHGCDGSPTTSLEITLPESIVAATATVNPNWTISKTYAPLDEAIEQEHGDALTERVATVVYTAVTPLAADQRDTVALSLLLAGEEGDVLEFPVLQTCEVGETNWTGDEVPAITLTAASADDDHHSEAAGSSAPLVAAAEPDVLARVLGIGGLVVGAVGLVVGITARRAKS